jgi:hypothetical protein
MALQDVNSDDLSDETSQSDMEQCSNGRTNDGFFKLKDASINDDF